MQMRSVLKTVGRSGGLAPRSGDADDAGGLGDEGDGQHHARARNPQPFQSDRAGAGEAQEGDADLYGEGADWPGVASPARHPRVEKKDDACQVNEDIVTCEN